MNKQEIKRYNQYDLLRVIAAIAVILIHVNYRYFEPRAYAPSWDKYYVIESIFNMVSRFSVPIFVMLSGAFLLHKTENGNAKQFYRKSIIKIWLPTLGVIALFTVIDVLRNMGSAWSFRTYLHSIIIGNYYNLWFMYMLAGLYVLTPFRVRMKNAISPKMYRNLTAVLLVWAVVSQAESTYQVPYALGVVVAYLGYFMAGNWIFENTKKKPGAMVYFLIAALMFAVTFVMRFNGFSMFDAYTSFFSPTIMMASLCIFAGVSRIEIKRDFSKISSYMFSVYLFHTIVMGELYFTMNEVFDIVMITLLTFAGALVCAVIYDGVWGVIRRKYIARKQ